MKASLIIPTYNKMLISKNAKQKISILEKYRE